MKNLFFLVSILTLFSLSSCKDCSLDVALIVPEQSIRIVNGAGDDLVFGDSAVYDVSEIEFIHERLGVLDFTFNESQQRIMLSFEPTQNMAEEIVMNLDSVTSEALTYNTLVFTNNECDKEYVLSYVKLNGEQVCGSCGDPAFNKDPIIYLEL